MAEQHHLLAGTVSKPQMSAIREVSSVSRHVESQGMGTHRTTKQGQYKELEPEVIELVHEMVHDKSKSNKATDESLRRQRTDPG